ncbi:MAG: endospore germination permease [Clostridia bacterium]|nr:endospore germination permease [Clostridia bacterium]
MALNRYTQITGSQLSLLLITVVGATAILYAPAMSIRAAGQNAWLSLLVPATLYGLLVVWVTTKLALRFPGRTFGEYTKEILGFWPGRLLCLLYFLYVASLLVIIVREFGNVLSTAFMPETPLAVFSLTLLLLALYAALGGPEVICRVNEFILPILLFTLMLMLFFLLKDTEPARLLPFLDEGLWPVLKGSKVASAFRGEVFVLMWLVCHLEDPSKSTRRGMQAVMILGVLLMLDVVAILTVMGRGLASLEVFPILSLTRYINVSYFLSRVEGLAMVVWVTGVVIKSSVLFYVALDLAKDTFRTKNRWHVVPPLVAGLLAGVVYGFKNDLQMVW